MGVKYSGKIISTGNLTVVSDTSGLPQGVDLVNSYDASFNTFPTDQGWTGSNSASSIVTDNGDLSLKKTTVNPRDAYAGSQLSDGWFADVTIKVERSDFPFYSHCILIRSSTNSYVFEVFTEKFVTYVASHTDQRLIAEYDFQTDYVRIRLLHNETTGYVEVYFDDTLITDTLDLTFSGTLTTSEWGDVTNVSGQAGNVAYWRKVQFYNSWSE